MPTNITFGSVSLRAYGYTLGLGTVTSNNAFYFQIQDTTSVTGGSIYSLYSTSSIEPNTDGSVVVYATVGSVTCCTSLPFKILRYVVDKDGTYLGATTYYADAGGGSGYMGRTIKDASGNTWIATIVVDAFSNNTPYLMQINSSNALVSTKSLYSGYNSDGFLPNGITIDSSGNIWTAYTNNTWNCSLAVWAQGVNGYLPGTSLWVKHNSSGTPIGGYLVSGVAAGGIAADTAGNLIFAGTVSSGATAATQGPGKIYKVPSATPTSFTWTATLPTATICYSVGVDSSNNVFAFATSNTDSPSAVTAYLVKYNAAGTLQWAKSWSLGNRSNINSNIQFDSSGNPYIAYADNSTVSPYNRALVIAKFDTNGTPIFFRRLISATNSSWVSAAGVSSFRVSGSYMYVGGQLNNASNLPQEGSIIFKVPTDGTLTQTFTAAVSGLISNTFTYANFSVTVSTASGFTNATATGSSTAVVVTSTDYTASSASVTLAAAGRTVKVL